MFSTRICSRKRIRKSIWRKSQISARLAVQWFWRADDFATSETGSIFKVIEFHSDFRGRILRCFRTNQSSVNCQGWSDSLPRPYWRFQSKQSAALRTTSRPRNSKYEPTFDHFGYASIFTNFHHRYRDIVFRTASFVFSKHLRISSEQKWAFAVLYDEKKDSRIRSGERIEIEISKFVI